MRNPKIKCCKLAAQCSVPASSLSGASLRGILCSTPNSEISPQPLCVMSPQPLLTADIQFQSPLKVKIYAFYPSHAVFMTIPEASFLSLDWSDLMDTGIQCLDLVSKCGPTSGFHSSLGSYFLYRDVIAATKTDLQSHSIQTEVQVLVVLAVVVQ